MSTKLKSKVLQDVQVFRLKTSYSQTVFWARFGVTQSGGSRYESGRPMPLCLAILLTLVEQGVVSDEQLAAAKKIAQNTLSGFEGR